MLQHKIVVRHHLQQTQAHLRGSRLLFGRFFKKQEPIHAHACRFLRACHCACTVVGILAVERTTVSHLKHAHARVSLERPTSERGCSVETSLFGPEAKFTSLSLQVDDKPHQKCVRCRELITLCGFKVARTPSGMCLETRYNGAC